MKIQLKVGQIRLASLPAQFRHTALMFGTPVLNCLKFRCGRVRSQ